MWRVRTQEGGFELSLDPLRTGGLKNCVRAGPCSQVEKSVTSGCIGMNLVAKFCKKRFGFRAGDVEKHMAP